MKLLIQFGDGQYVLLPVLLTTFEEVGHARLQVTTCQSILRLCGAAHFDWGPILAAGTCIYTIMLISFSLPLVLMTSLYSTSLTRRKGMASFESLVCFSLSSIFHLLSRSSTRINGYSLSLVSKHFVQ